MEIKNLHVILTNHVLDGGLDRRRLDSVDRAPSEAEKTITSALHKLIRDLVGDFNSLVLDGETADGDNISTDVAACRRRVSVRDLPGAALGSLPSTALGWVKDSVTSLLALSLDVLREFGRPDPELSVLIG